MDPLSIAAGVVGIVAPTLHCVRLLIDDVQKIVDAPNAVKLLSDDLLTINTALTSLQAISDQQWASLGESVMNQSKSAMASCKTSCDIFKADLSRWTRHSTNGKLAWRDRATVGVFKQGQMKSISAQLQNSRISLTLVVTIATLHSSLHQTSVAEGTMERISAKETEITNAIATTDRQLVEWKDRQGSLVLASPEQDETEEDRVSAINQVAVEQTALGGSRRLLEELLLSMQAAAEYARKDQDRVVNNFGAQNQGMQIGVSHGSISGITFGTKEY